MSDTPAKVPAMPAGWWPAEPLSKAMIDRASVVLNMPGYTYGQGEIDIVENRVLAFRVEPHFYYASGAPSTWHRGVTVWERREKDAPNPPELLDKRPDAFDRASKESMPWILLLLGAAGVYFISRNA